MLMVEKLHVLFVQNEINIDMLKYFVKILFKYIIDEHSPDEKFSISKKILHFY